MKMDDNNLVKYLDLEKYIKEKGYKVRYLTKEFPINPFTGLISYDYNFQDTIICGKYKTGDLFEFYLIIRYQDSKINDRYNDGEKLYSYFTYTFVGGSAAADLLVNDVNFILNENFSGIFMNKYNTDRDNFHPYIKNYLRKLLLGEIKNKKVC